MKLLPSFSSSKADRNKHMTKHKERERKTCKQNPLFHPILFLDTLSHLGASFLCAEEWGRRPNFLHLQTLSFWVFLSISQATPCCSPWSSIMRNNMESGLLMGLVPLRSGIYFICIWKREGETCGNQQLMGRCRKKSWVTSGLWKWT